MKTEIGLNFLEDIVKTTGVLLLLFLPFGFYYWTTFDTLALFSGGIWGVINFIFISSIVKLVLSPNDSDKIKAAKLAVIKFPLLYLAGYFLLSVPQFNAAYLTIGFSSLFGVLVLRAIISLIIPSSNNNRKKSEIAA